MPFQTRSVDFKKKIQGNCRNHIKMLGCDKGKMTFRVILCYCINRVIAYRKIYNDKILSLIHEEMYLKQSVDWKTYFIVFKTLFQISICDNNDCSLFYKSRLKCNLEVLEFKLFSIYFSYHAMFWKVWIVDKRFYVVARFDLSFWLISSYFLLIKRSMETFLQNFNWQKNMRSS